MPKPFDLLIRRLASLLPNELKAVEFPQLLLPNRHSLLLSQRRATMIVNRVRLFAFLFALLTPLWSVIDLIVFDYPLWSSLAVSRLLASMAFASLLVFYRPMATCWMPTGPSPSCSSSPRCSTWCHTP